MSDPPWPFADGAAAVPIAHRGGIGVWPENSMEAFAEAVALGFRYVETDVHLTADGVLVAFHDESLDRVSDRSGRIGELTWPELTAARIGGRARIPRFREILDAWPDLFVNIDPKSDATVEPLISLLRDADALHRVCIGSFASARLRRLRAAFGNRLWTSMGPGEVIRMRAASFGMPLGSMTARLAQVPVRRYGIPVVDRLFVDAAHRHGLKVHVWTVNDRSQAERLLDLGVDGVMSDDLAMLKSVFRARGIWQSQGR